MFEEFQNYQQQNTFEREEEGGEGEGENAYVTTTLEEDSPIFQLDTVQFQVPNRIQSLVVSNDILVLVIEGSKVLRIKLQTAHDIQELSIPGISSNSSSSSSSSSSQASAGTAFMDPAGRHLLLTTPQGDNFYYLDGWPNMKQLARFKNIEIASAAWVGDTVWVGSHDGKIYQAKFKSKWLDARSKRCEVPVKCVAELPVRERVLGLIVRSFPKRPDQHVVLVGTGTRLYQAVGDMREALEKRPNFQEIPGMPGPGRLAASGECFGWLTSMGVFVGKLTLEQQEAGDSVVENAVLLPYPSMDRQPLGLALTEFHIILQHTDSVQAINRLDSRMVFEQPQRGLGGLTMDPIKGTLWLFSPMDIYEVVVADEDRDVWEIYLKQRLFDKALGRCYNEAQRDQVMRAQADYLFEDGDTMGAAGALAGSSVAVEEALLRLLDYGDQRLVKRYLVGKLETLRRQDRTQVCLVAMWLVEIYLGLLDESDEIQQELYEFVDKYGWAIDPPTAYQLALSHGQRDFWLHFATLRGDHQMVVEYWIEREEYLRAIEVLGHHGTAEMFYQYAPQLMKMEARALVDILMRQPGLSASRLMPTLVAAGEQPIQAIRYLRFCIQKQHSKDPVVYNYYLTLLAKGPQDNEGELMEFLTTYGREGMLYDPDYALRICRRYRRTLSCVHLYGLLKLHEDAVELALESGDMELAEIHSEKPKDPKESKRLWLRIAQHMIRTEKPAAKVMEMVRRSQRLGVEDVLPHFPGFSCVDDFRDDIVGALEDYEAQIRDLRGEMDEASRASEAMQQDMAGLKNRFVVLSAQETCRACRAPLWLRRFYVFPCQHPFHADCLIRRVVGGCNRVQRQRIQELQAKINELVKTRRRMKLGGVKDKDGVEDELARLQDELDRVVAGECVLCGEMMIREVGEPFMDDMDTTWSI